MKDFKVLEAFLEACIKIPISFEIMESKVPLGSSGPPTFGEG